MSFSSSLLEQAVHEFSKLPGIGKKTALRLVLHLLKEPKEEVLLFTDTIAKLRKEIKFCSQCFNVADADTCNICNNPSRKKHIICVVESIRDVIAIESTQQFNGIYNVLGGIISQLDGIGPGQLTIDSLVNRIEKEDIDEIIFALSPTIQGDTTIYYISKKLSAGSNGKGRSVKITSIARGIAFGGELEYADEMTLAKSITNRIPVENFMVSGN